MASAHRNPYKIGTNQLARCANATARDYHLSSHFQRRKLKPKPRQGEVDASNHREGRNYPYPSRPQVSCRTSGEPRCDNANHQCPDCRRGRPAIPVHRRSKKAHCWIGDIGCVLRTRKHDTERRKHSEQRKVLCDRYHVQEAKCRPERECKAAERSR